MRPNRRWIASGATVAALVAAVTGTALAQAGEQDDVPVTGQALEQVTDAAIDHLGEGRVTDTEVEDDDAERDDEDDAEPDEAEVEGVYEVEVTLDDGRQVELELDEQFNVVGEELEDDDEDDDTDDDDADEGVDGGDAEPNETDQTPA